MKKPKKKQLTREQYSNRYFKLAADAGDLALRIEGYKLQLSNLQSTMRVVLHQAQNAPEGGETAPKTDEDFFADVKDLDDEDSETEADTETSDSEETAQ